MPKSAPSSSSASVRRRATAVVEAGADATREEFVARAEAGLEPVVGAAGADEDLVVEGERRDAVAELEEARAGAEEALADAPAALLDAALLSPTAVDDFAEGFRLEASGSAADVDADVDADAVDLAVLVVDVEPFLVAVVLAFFATFFAAFFAVFLLACGQRNNPRRRSK